MASFNFPVTNPDSLRAMAYSVRNQLSGGSAVDDSPYSIRLLEHKIKHMVNLVQKMEDEKNELLGIAPNETRTQIFPCIQLADTTDFNCKCTNPKVGGSFKKAKIPTMYEWRGQPYLSYVGNTDMDVEFVPMQSINALNAYASEMIYPSYFLANGSIYVSLPKKFKTMCAVTVMGIPEDLTATNGLCFDPWSSGWKIPSHIKAMAEERVLQSFGQLLLPTTPNKDSRNNGTSGNVFVTSKTP